MSESCGLFWLASSGRVGWWASGFVVWLLLGLVIARGFGMLTRGDR